MEQSNRNALILRFAELATREIQEKNADASISAEKQDITDRLGMSVGEIIIEASKLVVPQV